MSTSRLRCAIYTRKSSEEGLEQGFNSLHAQREACEAYVRSQAGEGWIALPTIYDDGGYSGGTLERPALTQLLADIEGGAVDVVVVYKVDRLTRALSDFARIVEIFDRRGVSFVSVTQAFNTTSSMGRLTLNVLLSFAQFEREVTGERIRDKIAVSKAKGMWMGGNVPLGYEIPTDRQSRVLVVNPTEAETVRLIFARYLALGSVRALAADLAACGVTTKHRIAGTGQTLGGGPWREGPLYHLLKNRLYRGEIVHKGKRHPGQHVAIVPEDLFDAVQTRLAEGAQQRANARTGSLAAALVGKIFDDQGHPMSPVSARRGGRTYRYYVSQAVIRSDRGAPGSLARIPAYAIETLIEAQLAARGAKPQDLRRVVAAKGFVEMTFASELEGPRDVVIRLPAILKTRGGVKQLIGAELASNTHRSPDEALLRAIARAKRWDRQLVAGERAGADEIAAAEGLQSRYVDKVLQLAWLSPEIVDRLLAGERPQDLNLTQLIGQILPLKWDDQLRLVALA